MKNATLNANLDDFLDAFIASKEAMIWYGDGPAWRARAETQNGVFILARPDGTTGYPSLEGLLSVLAGAGIRRIAVEWDGFPAAN